MTHDPADDDQRARGIRGGCHPRWLIVAGLATVVTITAWWYVLDIDREWLGLLGLCAGSVLAAAGSALTFVTAWRERLVLPPLESGLYVVAYGLLILFSVEVVDNWQPVREDLALSLPMAAFAVLILLPLDGLWLRATRRTPFLLDLLLCPVVAVLLWETFRYLQYGAPRDDFPFLLIYDPILIVSSTLMGGLAMSICDGTGASRLLALTAAAVVPFVGCRFPM